MEDLNIDKNSSQQKNVNKIDINNINKIPCRCPNCYLIPSIRMYEEENILKLSFKCGNNHNFNDEYNNLYNQSKIDFNNVECKKCNIKNYKINFIYVMNVFTFFAKIVKMSIKKKIIVIYV